MEWLQSQGADDDVVWTRIVDLMVPLAASDPPTGPSTPCAPPQVKTVIMAEPKLARAYHEALKELTPLQRPPHCLCYEILGFDVMLDAELKPWIIEINHAPCFGGGTKLDTRIKAV